MKRLFGILSAAAFAPLALVAGFAEYLDVSALDDIPDECKKLSGNITEIGTRNGNIWIPADVSASDETGFLVYNGSSSVTRPTSLEAYIDFGTYSDEDSIESFMNRGYFWETTSEGRILSYTSDSIKSIYTEMETENYNTFEAICMEIEQNVEKFVEEESQSNGGIPTDRAVKAAAALKKFYDSGRAARLKSSAEVANIFAKKMRQAMTAIQKAKATQALLAAQKTSSLKSSLASRLDSLASTFEKFCMRYMNDMNTLGAYLGSTNAMAYFSAKRDITDDAVLERWFKFSPPQTLDNPEDVGIKELGGYNTIFPFLLGGYYPMALPVGWLSSFLGMYKEVGALEAENIRGFYEDVQSSGDTSVTNWYANKITAPKNWADGSTIVVENGKFKVGSSTSPWTFFEGKIINCVVQVGNELVYYGSSALDSKYTVNATGTHYCHVTVPTDTTQDPTVTIDTTSTSGENQFTYPVCEIAQTNGAYYATYQLATMPMVIIYE